MAPKDESAGIVEDLEYRLILRRAEEILAHLKAMNLSEGGSAAPIPRIFPPFLQRPPLIQSCFIGAAVKQPGIMLQQGLSS